LPRYNLGVVLKRAGRPNDAIAAYRDALRVDPTLHRAQHNLANLLAAEEGKSPDELIPE